MKVSIKLTEEEFNLLRILVNEENEHRKENEIDKNRVVDVNALANFFNNLKFTA